MPACQGCPGVKECDGIERYRTRRKRTRGYTFFHFIVSSALLRRLYFLQFANGSRHARIGMQGHQTVAKSRHDSSFPWSKFLESFKLALPHRRRNGNSAPNHSI